MFLENIHGIDVRLGIKGYRKSTRDTWDEDWCKCDVAFKFGDIIDYHHEEYEMLLSDEVVELSEKLSDLLSDKIEAVTEVTFIEPDFVFVLHPKRDLREDSRYIQVQKGYEIEDIYVEWRIYFWNQGLTDNFLTVTLDRKRIITLRDYLLSVYQGK